MGAFLQRDQLVLRTDDLVTALRQRGGVLVSAPGLLIDPAQIGFIVRERGDEVAARHAGTRDAGIHDGALVRAYAPDGLTQIRCQDIHNARHQLERHGLLGQLVTQLLYP